jgi:hypothetical protein
MAKSFITPAEAKELARLYQELGIASQRALDALRTDPPGHKLEGEALARFAAADKAVGEIMKEIRAIRGD